MGQRHACHPGRGGCSHGYRVEEHPRREEERKRVHCARTGQNLPQRRMHVRALLARAAERKAELGGDDDLHPHAAGEAKDHVEGLPLAAQRPTVVLVGRVAERAGDAAEQREHEVGDAKKDDE